MGSDSRVSEDHEGTQSSEDKRATDYQCFPQSTYSTIIFNMMHRLRPGVYQIISVAYKEDLGLSRFANPIYPPPPVPVVVLPDGVLPPKFIVELVVDEPETYLIKVQEDMSPVIKNTRGVPGPEDPRLPDPRVFAFENEPAEKWVVLHREDDEDDDIYTIERKPGYGNLAWTAPRREEPEPERQILLRELIVRPADPPIYDPFQLFKFQFVCPA
ncbi:hypothetical protein F5J12DRAFT_891408 [Pisolithus orientalis]|uniref:uncharacterized protein n=1 Tax=Pisolithus orientalis TaxID=936130 RepID=UPI002225633C|nr:uncharacterized protein F5J12DRAFT_891408 [Pisolithus orientalis]KAI6010905.1 hypothetical protein F5J12DRAFT_891408 [Pisolithus orientalis]